MGLSRLVTAILNFFILLVAIAILGTGIWLKTRSGASDCMKVLDWPIITIGVILLIVALVGFVGACAGVPALLWIYLFAVFILMVLLLAFTVFAFVVTNAKAGQVVSGRGYKEYQLGDYSHWLQDRVNNTKNWAKISSCIRDSEVCTKLGNKYSSEVSLFGAKLAPVQAGCCIPPADCGYTMGSNATTWVATSPAASNDTDCQLFGPSSQQLCYQCNSCKAGLLRTVRNDWRAVAIVNVIAFVAVFVVYSIGCCAFRSSQREFGFQKGFV